MRPPLKLSKTLVASVVKVRPPKPEQKYWCMFCGLPAYDDGRFPDGLDLEDHLNGICGKEILRQALK